MQKLIIKIILNILFQCDGYSLPEETLLIQANNKLDGMSIGTDELKTQLQHCKSKGWIDYIVDDIDGSRKWYITGSGKVVRS